ncbi:MAG: hypothetical protein ACYDHU_04000 [Acidimicrobiales bacterium]
MSAATKGEVGIVDETRVFDPMGDAVAPAVHGAQVSGGASGGDASAGDRIRDLVAESVARGAPMISAVAVQGRLFAVYDDASAVPDALALVQRHLGLTLDRNWYNPQEIETLAGQLDGLLAVGALAPGAGGDVEPTEEA